MVIREYLEISFEKSDQERLSEFSCRIYDQETILEFLEDFHSFWNEESDDTHDPIYSFDCANYCYDAFKEFISSLKTHLSLIEENPGPRFSRVNLKEFFKELPEEYDVAVVEYICTEGF